ncbi:MAG: hypothetical protein LC097_01585, partial [Burkholderiales bacterium]|nr:hypothetical protein [Burkholderiales bacterium]
MAAIMPHERAGCVTLFSRTASTAMLHRLLHALGQALARYLSRPRPSAQNGVPTDRRALAQCLRPGDVLLMEGSSRVSSAIKYLTQSTWSHAAFYVGPQLGGEDAQGRPYLLI